MDKENVTLSPMKSDDVSFYGAAGPLPPLCTGTSPNHCVQFTGPRRPLEDFDLNSQDSGYASIYHETFGKFTVSTSSPMRSTVSFSSASMSYMEEDFFEDFTDLEPLDNNLPHGLDKLINLPRAQQAKNMIPDVVMRESPVRPIFRRAMSLQNERTTPNTSRARCLFGDERTTFKRPDPPSTETSPSSVKKHKKIRDVQEMNNAVVPTVFQRSVSATEESIKYALHRSSTEPDLIGDFSKSFCLPMIQGRHQDLKSISSSTLVKLLRGTFDSRVASFKVIDCRYPYEFDGGHINGAINIYTKEQCLELLSDCNIPPQDETKRHILVFHCEFSSERGPNLCRFLRKEDRQKNEDAYPALHYPEIYLLEGGYKNFFENYKELCVPISYKPMLHPDHEHDLRKFRQKSKTWNHEARHRPPNRATQLRRIL